MLDAITLTRIASIMIVVQFSAAALSQESSGSDYPTQQRELPPPVPFMTETRRPPTPPSVAPKPDLRRSAVPKDAREWSSRILEDYPAEALREKWEGTVAFRLRTTPEGRADTCEVKQSSGYPILDNAACTGLLRYATFNPALDHLGQPVAGEWSARFTYRIKILEEIGSD